MAEGEAGCAERCELQGLVGERSGFFVAETFVAETPPGVKEPRGEEWRETADRRWGDDGV